MGGKSRISKSIAILINTYTDATLPFVSLFCGTCSVESKINNNKKILNDKHEYLIEMFKGLQNGYDLPESISEDEYRSIKQDLNKDKVLSGFVGFGCSFGGKWFGGYARSCKTRDQATESKKSVLKDMEGLKYAEFLNLDYKDVEIPKGSVIYADPPYKDTTMYGSKLKFDSEEFWDYMRKISIDNFVFISEEQAPDDFECIWEKELYRTLDVNKNNQPIKIEKLFLYSKGKNNISNKVLISNKRNEGGSKNVCNEDTKLFA